MALVSCSECGSQVSDKAVACPKCGNPIAALTVHAQPTQPAAYAQPTQPITVEVAAAPVITTEATGKSYKGAQIVGAAIMCLGMFGCAANIIPPGGGGAMFVIGGVVYLGAAALAWWDHG